MDENLRNRLGKKSELAQFLKLEPSEPEQETDEPGVREKHVGLLQAKRGYTKEKAEEEADGWFKRL